ncbi:MAG: hypothetical protein JHC39_04835 [Lentimicrobium sp.]|nr:hypothetical protein [Lentimicrobium sp.]
MKKIVIILALVLTSTMTFAQDAPPAAAPVADPPASKFTASVDVVFPYLWRGILLNSASKVAFQPYASYAITDKLTAGVWGSTNFSNDDKTYSLSYNEFDWYVSYQVTPIVKVMLSDYYYDYPTVRGSYFDYSSNGTQALDLSVLLNFADKGVPLDFQWNTLIGGNDYNSSGNRNFSSYTEAGYTHSIASVGLDLRVFAGAVVNESNYYVTPGFKFTNVGLNIAKSIKISDSYSIPVFVRYTYNENGNYNTSGDLKKNFISGGMTFTIK